MSAKQKNKVIVATGKRKRAVARATVKPGSGRILINGRPVSLYVPRLARERILEPVYLCDKSGDVDIEVNVYGGGPWGQADAIRTAIGRGLAEYFGEEVKNKFLEYDRSMLVSDHRRTEPHKPSRSSAGPRRKKQQSKR